jgi:hypothetical protein
MARTEVFVCDLGAADGGTTRHRLPLDVIAKYDAAHDGGAR